MSEDELVDDIELICGVLVGASVGMKLGLAVVTLIVNPLECSNLRGLPRIIDPKSITVFVSSTSVPSSIMTVSPTANPVVWVTSTFVSPGAAFVVPCVTPGIVGAGVGVRDGIPVGFSEGVLVGLFEGIIVGRTVGAVVGKAVVGIIVGNSLGVDVGTAVVGILDGIAVGEEQPAQVTIHTSDTSCLRPPSLMYGIGLEQPY